MLWKEESPENRRFVSLPALCADRKKGRYDEKRRSLPSVAETAGELCVLGEACKKRNPCGAQHYKRISVFVNTDNILNL